MVLLRQLAIGGPDGLEVGIRVQLEHRQRPHLVAASGFVAGTGPAPVSRASKAARTIGFVRRALCRFFGAQPCEIIPVLVVFAGVLLAEIPALATVGSLGAGRSPTSLQPSRSQRRTL